MCVKRRESDEYHYPIESDEYKMLILAPIWTTIEVVNVDDEWKWEEKKERKRKKNKRILFS
jgi:hypothetical protein